MHLADVQKSHVAVNNQAGAAEDQIRSLETVRQELTSKLQAAVSAKDKLSQQERAVQERSAGLAAELESKDCRLRSVIFEDWHARACGSSTANANEQLGCLLDILIGVHKRYRDNAIAAWGFWQSAPLASAWLPANRHVRPKFKIQWWQRSPLKGLDSRPYQL